MTSKPATNIVESAVPKTEGMQHLSDHEKKVLEKSELAEHAHGNERENLQKEAAHTSGHDSSK